MLNPFRSFLFNEAGDGGGGGGTPPAPQPAPLPPAQPPSPAPGAPQPEPPDAAPVSRAEFDALTAKLASLTEAPPAPPKAPAPAPAEMPNWAKALAEQVSTLTAQNKQHALSERRQQLVAGAIADIPEANRPMAQAVLDGMLARSGVDLSGDVDLAQLSQQFSGQLRSQFGDRLYTVPGSQFKAVPKSTNGGFDWSGVHNLTEVPPELIKHIPDDVYRRLRGGGGSSAVLPDGGIMPRSRFSH